MARRPVRKTRRREIEERARDVGAAAAAHEAGLPPATVRSWLSRSRQADGQTSPGNHREPGEEAPGARGGATTRAARREGADGPHMAGSAERVREVWEGAQQALAATRAAVERRNATDSRSYATTAGILVDKGLLLEARLAELAERRQALDAAQAEVVASVLAMTLEASGLDGCPAVRALLADLLRQVGGDAMVADPAKAAEARRQVEAVVGGRLREQLLGELAAKVEPSWVGPARLALPAPGESESMEVEMMDGPVKRLRVLRERRRKREKAEQTREPEPAARRDGKPPLTEAEVREQREIAVQWDDSLWHPHGFG